MKNLSLYMKIPLPFNCNVQVFDLVFQPTFCLKQQKTKSQQQQGIKWYNGETVIDT